MIPPRHFYFCDVFFFTKNRHILHQIPYGGMISKIRKKAALPFDSYKNHPIYAEKS